MKLKEVFGKRVCEEKTGKTGYVTTVYATGDALQFLGCADEQDEEFTVDVQTVKKWGNVIIYEDRQSVWKACQPVRTGVPCYDATGAYQGDITDCIVKSNAITYALLGKKKVPYGDLVMGDVAILSTPSKGYVQATFAALESNEDGEENGDQTVYDG